MTSAFLIARSSGGVSAALGGVGAIGALELSCAIVSELRRAVFVVRRFISPVPTDQWLPAGLNRKDEFLPASSSSTLVVSLSIARPLAVLTRIADDNYYQSLTSSRLTLAFSDRNLSISVLESA